MKKDVYTINDLQEMRFWEIPHDEYLQEEPCGGIGVTTITMPGSKVRIEDHSGSTWMDDASRALRIEVRDRKGKPLSIEGLTDPYGYLETSSDGLLDALKAIASAKVNQIGMSGSNTSIGTSR